PDGAEAAQADAFEELEFAQGPAGAGGGRVPGLADTEGAAAAGAKHLVGCVVAQVDGVMAVGAGQVGGRGGRGGGGLGGMGGRACPGRPRKGGCLLFSRAWTEANRWRRDLGTSQASSVCDRE